MDLTGDFALGRDTDNLPGAPERNPEVSGLVSGVAVWPCTLLGEKEHPLVGDVASLLVKIVGEYAPVASVCEVHDLLIF